MTYVVLSSPQVNEPVTLSIDYTEIMQRLPAFRETIEQRLERFAGEISGEIEAWMKTNASWIDRTAQARATLFARHWKEGSTIVIHFAQFMDYGIWLEIRWLGKYSILKSTLYFFSNEVRNRLGAS